MIFSMEANRNSHFWRARWEKVEVYGTSRGCEFNIVDFTEADREDGGRGAMVAEPVWSIHCLWAVDPNHEVPICQNLHNREWFWLVGTSLKWRHLNIEQKTKQNKK